MPKRTQNTEHTYGEERGTRRVWNLREKFHPKLPKAVERKSTLSSYRLMKMCRSKEFGGRASTGIALVHTARNTAATSFAHSQSQSLIPSIRFSLASRFPCFTHCCRCELLHIINVNVFFLLAPASDFRHTFPMTVCTSVRIPIEWREFLDSFGIFAI